MRSLGFDNVRVLDATLFSTLLAVGEHRVGDARRASRGDHTRRLAVAHEPGVEEVKRHRDDLAFKAGGARAHVALEGVLMGEQAERLSQERVVLVVPAVHRSRTPTSLPDGVLRGRDFAQFRDDLLTGAAALRERAIDPQAIGIGIKVKQISHLHSSPSTCAAHCILAACRRSMGFGPERCR